METPGSIWLWSSAHRCRFPALPQSTMAQSSHLPESYSYRDWYSTFVLSCCQTSTKERWWDLSNRPFCIPFFVLLLPLSSSTQIQSIDVCLAHLNVLVFSPIPFHSHVLQTHFSNVSSCFWRAAKLSTSLFQFIVVAYFMGILANRLCISEVL